MASIMSAQNTFDDGADRRAESAAPTNTCRSRSTCPKLVAVVEPRALRAEGRDARPRPTTTDMDSEDSMPLIGRSPAMQEIYRACWRG